MNAFFCIIMLKDEAHHGSVYSYSELLQRQLGARISRSSVYGSGIGPILLDNLSCTGNEDSLFDCQHSTIHNCVHSDDIGVPQCEPQCTNGDVRLVGGATPLQGWVELCVTNVRGRLCDPTWTINEITVMCNKLRSTIPSE